MDERISVVLSAVDNVSRPLKNMQRSFDYFSRTAEMGIGALTDETKKMAQELRAANKKSKDSLYQFRNEMIKVEYGFLKLTEAANDYAGRTDDFMDEVVKLGKQHKKVTDQMIANDERAKRSFIESVGTMLVRSTQSEKIAQNFERMGNPLYTVNNGLLRITQNFEEMAKAGRPAALALKMLGPTASMKELQDMTTLINRGLTRYQSVALAAAIASGILYTALFKVAKGPNPSEVYQQQAEALAHYAEEVDRRTNEIANAWNLFEDIQLKSVSSQALTKNLQEQVTELRNWKDNLEDIAQQAGKDFAKYLSEMGPQAAGEVATIAKMTGPQLDKYVALWKEKMSLAREQATTELEGLKIATDKKVKELQDSLTPLGLALEPMKQAWADVFKPMVQAFTDVAVPIVNFITKVGEMINKFNEANPKFAKFVQAVLMLVPILTLILAPLAIGIGLFGGLSAAFASIWTVIGPLVTGLASMLGTVLLVAAAIVGLAMAFVHAYENVDWFRNMVDTAWAWIKDAFSVALEFISNIVKTVMSEVSAFIGEKLAEIKAFWDENGTMIMEAAKNVWETISNIISTVMDVIQSVMKFVWPIIELLIVSTWEAIKGVISGALDIIMGVIKAFSALFTGNWSELWEAIKQIISGVVEFIWNFIQLTFVGKVVKTVKTFATLLKSLITNLWNGIKNVFTSSISVVSNAVTKGFNFIKSFVNNTLKTIRSTVTSVWNGIKSFISSVINGIKSFISNGFNAMKNTISNIMNSVKGVIESGWNKAKSFLEGINLANIGKNIIQGLINGIGSMANSLADKVSEMAGGIKDKIMDILGIHSPSRVMRDQVGKWIPIGLADGIDEQMRSVQTAANRMASTVIDSASLSKIDPQVSALVQSSATLEPASDEGPQIVNFERLFDGATINVREERDIKALAVELYNLQQNAKARKGVR